MFKYILPNIACEFWVSIRDNNLGQSMVSKDGGKEDGGKEDLGYFRGSGRCVHWLKMVLLERQSINTMMASCPCLVRGNCTMKFIVISSHLLFGVGNNWRSPAGI